MDRLKMLAMCPQNRGYSVVSRKSSSPPQSAVAL
jgi:hypothetical protein